MSGRWRIVVSHPYGVVILIYVILVLLVGALLSRRNPQEYYIATATLVHNHRIASGDVRRPFQGASATGWYLPDRSAMEGKYVSSTRVNACEDISPSSVQASPDLHTDAGLKLVVLPLPAGYQSSRILDAGSVVEILSSHKQVAEHATPKPVTKSKIEEQHKTKTPDDASDKQTDVGGNPAPQTATVQAIVCDAPTAPDKNPATCYAMLAVPEQVEEYIAKEKDSIRLVPKAIDARAACKGGANDASANVAKDHRPKASP